MLTKTQILDTLVAWAKNRDPDLDLIDYFMRAGLPGEVAGKARRAYFEANQGGTVFRREELKGTIIEGIWRAEIDAIQKALGDPPKPPIQAWGYEDAPAAYRAAIEDPSDLDWVVFVPDAYGEEPYLSFLTSPDIPPTVLPVEGGRLHLFYHA